MSTPKLAFVLADGGSLGAVQVGMLKALAAHGVKNDLIVGASAGAINGAYAAARPDIEGIAELERLWTNTHRRDIFPLTLKAMTGLFIRRDFLLDPAGLENLIAQHLPYRNLEDATVPLYVVTTDFLSGAMRVLSRGPAARAIMASCAIPAAFPSVQIEGHHLVD